MDHELVTVADDRALGLRAARFVAARAQAAVADHATFSFAVSGGRTPWAMFEELRQEEVPWERTRIFQVDERVAPAGDADRNLANLRRSLRGAPAEVLPMPVEEADLDAAAQEYAALLPARLDLVHLGLGADGHTASLVPNDPVLEVSDRLVALTGPYEGRRRMTLTYPALARASELLWLVAGADKRAALGKLLAGDRSIPAASVEAARSTILADAAAAEGLGA